MTLPIDSTTLIAAANNQQATHILASAANINALTTLFNNANEMYTYVQTFAAPGAIGTTNLADLAVTTAKLAALAVTTAKIALLAVDTAQLANLAVTNAKVATGIDMVKIADGSVTNTEVQYINSLTSNAQTQLDAKQALDSTLTALAAFNTNGLIKQTSADTFTAVAAPVGAVVGTTDTQTLTNKSIVASQITGQLAVANGGTGAATLTGILKGNGTGAVSAVTAPTGDIVGTTDSQTLTNKIITGTFTGNITGSVTGNVTGNVTGAVTGNADTVTTNANLTGDVTSVGNATAIAAGVIVDADVNTSAAIAWTKLSKSGSNLTDMATRLASDLTGTLNATQLPALTGDITSSAGSAVTALSVTGVAAGTYNNVTVDAKGRVTFGEQVIASASQSGDLSAAKYIQFDSLTPTGLGTYAVPVGQIFSLWGRYSFEQDATTSEMIIYEI